MKSEKQQITKPVINKKQIKALKRWSLTGFAVTLLITSLFVINVFAKTSNNPSQIVILTNQERVDLGLKSLTENKTLDIAASNKAKDMFAHQYFEHVSPQGKTPWQFIKQAGYDYAYAGENLAINFNDVTSTHKAWMNSSSHRANIINPHYSEIGYASVTDTFQGKPVTITVQMFGTSMFDTVLSKLTTW